MLAKECLEEFKVECDLRRLSPRTTKGYYNNTALFLNYLEKHDGIDLLERISHQHIKKYVQYLLKKNLSPSYINGILKCLRAFFKYAYVEGFCLDFPKGILPYVRIKVQAFFLSIPNSGHRYRLKS